MIPRTRRGSRAGSGSATRLRKPNGQSALHDPRDRRELRLPVLTREWGVLPDLRQQAANRQLSGSCPNAFSERRHAGSRSTHQSRRQQPSPQNARPTRLAFGFATNQRAAMRHGSETVLARASGSNLAAITIVALPAPCKLLIAIWRFVSAGPRTGGGDHRRIEFRRRSISGG